MLLDAIQAARAKTTVWMNGLMVPIDHCPTNFARFCRPVLFYNRDNQFGDFSLSGSCFMLKYRNRHLLLCTAHQLGEGQNARDPADMVVVIKDPSGAGVALTPNEAIRIKGVTGADDGAEDLFILEYDVQSRERDISNLFFDLDIKAYGNLDTVHPADVVAIFAVGYQTSSGDYEPTWDEDTGVVGASIVSRWSKLYLKPTEPGPWMKNKARIPLEVHDWQVEALIKKVTYDPDGFSGSPVMMIYKSDEHQHFLGFGGIITEADQFGRFAIYRTAHIIQLLDQQIDSPSL